MSSLAGKTVIVTGASKGIGAATAHAVIKAGARLIAHYGNDRAGAEKATSFARDGQVTLLKSDFSNMDAVDAFWSQALKAADGYIDVLVNNAGITRDGTLQSQRSGCFQPPPTVPAHRPRKSHRSISRQIRKVRAFHPEDHTPKTNGDAFSRSKPRRGILPARSIDHVPAPRSRPAFLYRKKDTSSARPTHQS